MMSIVFSLVCLLIGFNQADEGIVQFAHIGDWGHASESGLGKTVSSIKSDSSIKFLILGGDNFYETGVSDVHDDQFNTTYRRYFDRLPTSIDRYVILGNHDYYGNAISQILYSQYDPTWYSPYFYYHKQLTGNGVIICALFIDTYRIHQSGQLGFMHAVLGSDECQQSDTIFVFGHHPLFSSGGHGDLVDIQEAIENDLLVKYNVDVYVAGHDHLLSYHVNNGISHIVSGASSKKTTSSWYTSTSKADQTLFSNYGMHGYAKFSVSSSGIIKIDMWNSETDRVLFSHEHRSKKDARSAATKIPFDPRWIKGGHAWSGLNVFGLSFILFMVWFFSIVAIQPSQISSALKRSFT